jgi:hypothetical protein
MKRILAAGFLVLSGGVLPADELYLELAANLEQAEELVAGIVLRDDVFVTAEQLDALRSLNRQIRGSLYSDLIDRSDLLLLLTEEQMLLQRNPQIRMEEMLQDSGQDARKRKATRARDTALRVSFATTAVSFAAAYAFWGLGELQDRRYFESTTSEEASRHRRLFRVFSIGSIVGVTVGAVSAGLSVTLYTADR